MRRKLLAGVTATAALLIGIAVAAESWSPPVAEEAPQRRRRGGGFGGFGRLGTPYSTADLPIKNMPQEGKFTFLRLRFDEAYTSRGGYEWGLDMGWNHDFPRAEHNLTLMLEELTNLPITIDFRGGNIYSFSDPEIFDYPFVYISEAAFWIWNDEEVLNLRNYLLKGGFIMVDDMQSDDTEAFHRIINEAIPNTELKILDTSHPIFNCFFQITPEDILNQYYLSRYNGNPVIYGVYEDNDPGKRLMAVVNHNQDIGESWEFSNTGYVPVEQANNSYKIGINYILCSMLH